MCYITERMEWNRLTSGSKVPDAQLTPLDAL